MELHGLAVVFLVCTVSVVICESEEAPKSGTALVEARYDRYYDIFRYWWPWFSDLATVVVIKLKIAVIYVAMLVFGDGYYWSKWTGSSIFEKSQWTQIQGGPYWGHRRRRALLPGGSPAGDLAEFIFDTLDISDDSCRRRVVCELYLEGKRVPEISTALNGPGYEVFRAYRPKSKASSSSDCRKLHPCQLAPSGDGLLRLQQINRTDDGTDEDWRWPR